MVSERGFNFFVFAMLPMSKGCYLTLGMQNLEGRSVFQTNTTLDSNYRSMENLLCVYKESALEKASWQGARCSFKECNYSEITQTVTSVTFSFRREENF